MKKLTTENVQKILDLRQEHDKLREEWRVYKANGYNWRDAPVAERTARILELSYKNIGKRFGVCAQTVHNVVSGKFHKSIGVLK